ncbi:hypothetical protein C5167_024746 [Papaver somniferum]|uniref:Uncharacterized protein n=1 Tax=Papaver somniferum TaxID=3469 RepID=A0A4Y7JSK9_PAPSO|nr:hypothetical protein C5167_024746 [Papaver somniferum]
MAKITSLFLCFFLFVLIAMPTSSATRMILQEGVSGCPRRAPSCAGVVCDPVVFCPLFVLNCPDGQYAYKPCCSCGQTCCPIRKY